MNTKWSCYINAMKTILICVHSSDLCARRVSPQHVGDNIVQYLYNVDDLLQFFLYINFKSHNHIYFLQ